MLTYPPQILTHDPVSIGFPTEPQTASSPTSTSTQNVAAKQARILIVDDESLVVRVVRRLLEEQGYQHFETVTESAQAIPTMLNFDPDVVLLDIMMPGMSGIEILRERNHHAALQLIPIIILSASNDSATRRDALKLGCADFLGKPVDAAELILRVQNVLTVKAHQDRLRDEADELERQVRTRTRELEYSRQQVIQCLAKAAEFRDNDTGQHVLRVGKYAAILAEQLGFDRDQCEQMELAAQLHDVGKIGIPDSILLNPGKLSPDEFSVMQSHCLIGCRIIEPLVAKQFGAPTNILAPATEESQDLIAPILRLAAKIALTHHERWDGNGYPLGLKGEDIPIEGRIVAVADVYDALQSPRPYKPAFDTDKCLRIIIEETGTHFDPQVVQALFETFPRIERVRQQHRDH